MLVFLKNKALQFKFLIIFFIWFIYGDKFKKMNIYTEKWKNGILPKFREYYINNDKYGDEIAYLNEDNCFYSKHKNRYGISSINIINFKVLAPVPQYKECQIIAKEIEKYKAIQNRIEKLLDYISYISDKIWNDRFNMKYDKCVQVVSEINEKLDEEGYF